MQNYDLTDHDLTGEDTLLDHALSRLSVRLTVSAMVAGALLVGCGGDDSEPDATESDGGSSSTSPDSSESTSADDSSTSSSAPVEPATETSILPVPPDGPTTITEFPVPAGAEIADLGAFGGNWQFLIGPPDSETTIDFYRETLAAQGYTLREDISITVGANTVEYDLAFFGPAFGVVIADVGGGTGVTVDDEPINGVEP